MRCASSHLTVSLSDRKVEHMWNLKWPTMALLLICCTPAFADGRMEEARKAFFDVAQKSYIETMKNLQDNNQNAAEASAKQLHEALNNLENPLLYIEKDISSIDPSLSSRWSGVMTLFGKMRTSTGLLEEKIGNGDTSELQSNLKENFEKFGDEFNRAYDDFKRYGKDIQQKSQKFQVLCDSCR